MKRLYLTLLFQYTCTLKLFHTVMRTRQRKLKTAVFFLFFFFFKSILLDSALLHITAPNSLFVSSV